MHVTLLSLRLCLPITKMDLGIPISPSCYCFSLSYRGIKAGDAQNVRNLLKLQDGMAIHMASIHFCPDSLGLLSLWQLGRTKDFAFTFHQRAQED